MKASQLFSNPLVTEIIFQNKESLIYEKMGQLFKCKVEWSKTESSAFFSQVYESLPKAPNYEHPMAQGVWEDFRVQVVCPPAVTEGDFILQLRRLSSPTTLEKFDPKDWGAPAEVKNLVDHFVQKKKSNFLIVGPTGSGKSTFLKVLLKDYCQKDRVLCLEDTPELPQVNAYSCNLKCYVSSTPEVPDINLQDLLKASLRLRPDRLIMGEMRGQEAADFLLMLSTGHQGSGATLHAENAQDALRRLEMLVQMGQNWSLETVRRLIASSLEVIISMERSSEGKRVIRDISKITSLEDNIFLTHSLYSKKQNKRAPTDPPNKISNLALSSSSLSDSTDLDFFEL